MEENKKELNEMELLERNIIKNYNELLKTLEQVITDDEYRYQLMEMHTKKLRIGHEI